MANIKTLKFSDFENFDTSKEDNVILVGYDPTKAVGKKYSKNSAKNILSNVRGELTTEKNRATAKETEISNSLNQFKSEQTTKNAALDSKDTEIANNLKQFKSEQTTKNAALDSKDSELAALIETNRTNIDIERNSRVASDNEIKGRVTNLESFVSEHEGFELKNGVVKIQNIDSSKFSVDDAGKASLGDTVSLKPGFVYSFEILEDYTNLDLSNLSLVTEEDSYATCEIVIKMPKWVSSSGVEDTTKGTNVVTFPSEWDSIDETDDNIELKKGYIWHYVIRAENIGGTTHWAKNRAYRLGMDDIVVG